MFYLSQSRIVSTTMLSFTLLWLSICKESQRKELFHLMYHEGGGGSSIVKVPGDVPPARVCFFKPSSLAKGILFAKFSPFSLAKDILFANFRPFSLGKGILFGNFGQRNVKLREFL